MPKHPQLLLDNQLCFALYSTSLAMTQLYKQFLDPLELTYPQYLVLLLLWEKDGLSLKDIGDRLGQKSGALTPVIKRLEANGLIKRTRLVDNERTLSIELTKMGKSHEKQALKVNKCIAEACGMSQKELKNLQSLLEELRERLKS